ncbi:hypothetical protein CFC21_011223 [Triticum aestivum]|uniref:Uncharacterized protein n=2 Tax=Triticum aestivum TaxID=4565 RepID=A0A3B5ZTT7_WHEAT|nr:hypothetical protein CFC21_011223 [Triticum aestivum]
MADREAPPGSGIGRKRRCRDAGAAAGLPDPAAAAGGGNRLLAGYLAHEFLACGTVLGERRAPGGPDTGSEAARYEAVAALVQVGGACVPGVVNPAQLAAWATTR